MKVIALGAHPDDIEIYMFGLLSNFVRKKNDVKVVVASDGAAGTLTKSQDLVLTRKKKPHKVYLNLEHLFF